MYYLTNGYGVNKQVKKGFSWSMLLFGVFVPMVRGDWKYFFISLILAIITSGISWLIFPFVYNKLYLNDLLSSGYRIVNQ